MSESNFNEWAILELMGHRKMAGLVSEVQRFGTKLLRIDIPCEPPATQLYGGAAIYCITPTTEAIARAFAARAAPAPVSRWEITPERALPAPMPLDAGEPDDAEFEEADEDEAF